ncbi:hypothetical protein M3Y97_00541500 [Aphelenchoides bicaudatus]|nr:hypothetical protein M3Y97_00541500 [Aphelenchoides bicaudatus]
MSYQPSKNKESPPNEDDWAWSEVGTPFPSSAAKFDGLINRYVALWYKHGNPCHGSAWQDNGVVKCSFPYPLNKTELANKEDVIGTVQILQYTDNHEELGFWYNWVKYSNRPSSDEKSRQLMRCGNSVPVMWANCPGGAVLGFLDITKEVASFAFGGLFVSKGGSEVNDMLVLVREFNGSPPGCSCKSCGGLGTHTAIETSATNISDSDVKTAVSAHLSLEDLKTAIEHLSDMVTALESISSEHIRTALDDQSSKDVATARSFGSLKSFGSEVNTARSVESLKSFGSEVRTALDDQSSKDVATARSVESLKSFGSEVRTALDDQSSKDVNTAIEPEHASLQKIELTDLHTALESVSATMLNTAPLAHTPTNTARRLFEENTERTQSCESLKTSGVSKALARTPVETALEDHSNKDVTTARSVESLKEIEADFRTAMESASFADVHTALESASFADIHTALESEAVVAQDT